MISMLKSVNIYHIDLGPKAPVWIIDGPGVADYIEDFEERGYSFKYSPNGSKSTRGKAAYFT